MDGVWNQVPKSSFGRIDFTTHFRPYQNPTKASIVTIYSDITYRTNIRVKMKNEGLGGKYNNFHKFTLKELMQRIGIYLYQGISPYQ